MADVTIRNAEVNDYYIEIRIEVRYDRNVYVIGMYDKFGRTDRQTVKADEKSAIRTFNYYKRVAKNN